MRAFFALLLGKEEQSSDPDIDHDTRQTLGQTAHTLICVISQSRQPLLPRLDTVHKLLVRVTSESL